MLHDIQKINSIDADTYIVDVTFDDGTCGPVSLGFVFNNPKPMAAEVLAGDMFEKCVVLDGALTWPNGYDISPDTLYKRLTAQKPNWNLKGCLQLTVNLLKDNSCIHINGLIV